MCAFLCARPLMRAVAAQAAWCHWFSAEVIWVGAAWVSVCLGQRGPTVLEAEQGWRNFEVFLNRESVYFS